MSAYEKLNPEEKAAVEWWAQKIHRETVTGEGIARSPYAAEWAREHEAEDIANLLEGIARQPREGLARLVQDHKLDQLRQQTQAQQRQWHGLTPDAPEGAIDRALREATQPQLTAQDPETILKELKGLDRQAHEAGAARSGQSLAGLMARYGLGPDASKKPIATPEVAGVNLGELTELVKVWRLLNNKSGELDVSKFEDALKKVSLSPEQILEYARDVCEGDLDEFARRLMERDRDTILKELDGNAATQRAGGNPGAVKRLKELAGGNPGATIVLAEVYNLLKDKLGEPEASKLLDALEKLSLRSEQIWAYAEYVCKGNREEFARRLREIGGLDPTGMERRRAEILKELDNLPQMRRGGR